MGIFRLRLILPISIAQRARSFSIRTSSTSNPSILLRQSLISGCFSDLPIRVLCQPPAEFADAGRQAALVLVHLDLPHYGAPHDRPVSNAPHLSDLFGPGDPEANRNGQARLTP